MTESLQQKAEKNLNAISVRLFQLTLNIFERLLPLFGFKIKNFYDNTDFPWLQILEEYAPEIRREYLSNTNIHNIMSVQRVNNLLEDFTDDEGWKVVLLKSYDTVIEKNATIYPKTMEAIKKIPNVSNAIFSVLSPKKNIQIHRGMYRGIVFIHLGVYVPLPNNRHTFIVNGEQKYWEEGKAFGFEDSHLHEVINQSDDNRAILLLEVERQDIPVFLKPIHNWIFSKLRDSRNTKLIIENANAYI